MHRHDDVTAAEVRMLRQSRYTCMAAVVRILRRPPHNRQKAGKGAEVHNGHFSESLCIVAVLSSIPDRSMLRAFICKPLIGPRFLYKYTSPSLPNRPLSYKTKAPESSLRLSGAGLCRKQKGLGHALAFRHGIIFLPLQHHLLCVMVLYPFRYGIIFLASRHYFTNAAMGFRSPSTFVIKALAEPKRR